MGDKHILSTELSNEMSEHDSSDSMEDVFVFKPIKVKPGPIPQPHITAIKTPNLGPNGPTSDCQYRSSETVVPAVYQHNTFPLMRSISQGATLIKCLANDGNHGVQPADITNQNLLNGIVKFPPIIRLNVGGIKYMTRLSTLIKYSDSMLAAMFSGRYPVDKDEDGNYFLDSCGTTFGYILDFLRNSSVPPNDVAILVFREANYYGLHELSEKLKLKPEIACVTVKEAHKSLFPNYNDIREQVITLAIKHAEATKIGEVIIYAFRTEFVPRTQTFNPNHGCVIDNAHIKIGPWKASVDEEAFMKCLENDLLEEGFSVRPHEVKRKCRYYHGQTCQKFVYKLQILF